jgi:hypothetical protein
MNVGIASNVYAIDADDVYAMPSPIKAAKKQNSKTPGITCGYVDLDDIRNCVSAICVGEKVCYVSASMDACKRWMRSSKGEPKSVVEFALLVVAAW